MKYLNLILICALQTMTSALAETPSLAECTATYDFFDRYVLDKEYPDRDIILPFDYDLRARAAKLRASQQGQETVWQRPPLADAPNGVVWTTAQFTLQKCDQRLGLRPTTSGDHMFGYPSGRDIDKPDNLACFAMLRIVGQQEKAKGNLESATNYDLRAESALTPLYLVGWSGPDLQSLAAATYQTFARRYSRSSPQNPTQKLMGEGELATFASQCRNHYEPATVQLSEIKVGDRETYCSGLRQKGRTCDDALSRALAGE